MYIEVRHACICQNLIKNRLQINLILSAPGTRLATHMNDQLQLQEVVGVL